MNYLKSFILFVLVSTTLSLSAESAGGIVGRWITIDDKSGIAKSVVEIYQAEDGLYYGRILKVLVKGGEDALCVECPGDLKNKPIVGLVILQGMEFRDGKLQGGHVMDPENGKSYHGKVWINPDNGHLVLRGSIDRRGILGRNQEWIRCND